MELETGDFRKLGSGIWELEAGLPPYGLLAPQMSHYPAMPDPLVSAEKVVKRYVLGEEVVTAVDGVTVSFGAGEMAAVVGRSGSGKSTLLHLLGGLDRPTSGRVLARGRRLDELSDDELAAFRRTTVGF